MTKNISCQTKIKNKINQIRVRVIKAPLVKTEDLRLVMDARSRAIVL
jgi:hypothetical protein